MTNITSTTTKVVRRYLPHLALKVHPDRFPHHPQISQANSENLKLLNEVVADWFPVKGIASENFEKDGDVNLRIEFWCSAALKQESTQELEQTHILCSHHLSSRPATKAPSPNASSFPMRHLYLAQSFMSLYSKLAIPTKDADVAHMHEALSKLGPKRSSLKDRAKTQMRHGERRGMRRDFENALKQNMNFIDTLSRGRGSE